MTLHNTTPANPIQPHLWCETSESEYLDSTSILDVRLLFRYPSSFDVFSFIIDTATASVFTEAVLSFFLANAVVVTNGLPDCQKYRFTGMQSAILWTIQEVLALAPRL